MLLRVSRFFFSIVLFDYCQSMWQTNVFGTNAINTHKRNMHNKKNERTKLLKFSIFQLIHFFYQHFFSMFFSLLSIGLHWCKKIYAQTQFILLHLNEFCTVENVRSGKEEKIYSAFVYNSNERKRKNSCVTPDITITKKERWKFCQMISDANFDSDI